MLGAQCRIESDNYSWHSVPTIVATLSAWVPGATTALLLSFYGPTLLSYRSRAIAD